MQLKAEPDWLRAEPAFGTQRIGVDREANVIHGYVVAQLGPFKSEGRGEFSSESLKEIIRLGNESQRGLKSRFSHPALSDDGIGKYLGRAKNFRQEGQKVRADLHFNETALRPPPDGGGTPLGEYVMDLAESDPAAFSSSLVLKADQQYRLAEDGTRQKDAQGSNLPPIWMPTELHASDVVDTGDAVDDFLSADRLPDHIVRQASSLIDEQFKSAGRDVIQARLTSYVQRYLENRFGPDGSDEHQPLRGEPETMAEDTKQQLEELQKSIQDLSSVQTKTVEALTSVTQQLAEMKQESSQRQQEELRASAIVTRCEMAGCPDKAAEFIANAELSAADVTDKLFAQMCAGRPLSENNGEGEEKTADAKLAAEYDAAAETHAKLGVSKQQYIELRSKQSERLQYDDDGCGLTFAMTPSKN